MRRTISSLRQQLGLRVTPSYVYSPIESETLRAIIWFFVRKTLSLSQTLGLNITRNYFYSPIPDLRELNDDVLSSCSELISINLNEEKQLELLATFASAYKNEYELFPREKTAHLDQYYTHNRAFESVDGEVLYCMIRHFKPQKIIEIGSGFSTRLIVAALMKNKKEDAQYNGHLTVIDPYSRDLEREVFPHFSPLRLIRQKVQHVPLSTFGTLSENDMLFIDSSHVIKTGGDVVYDYLEILPRLRKGVIIHLHDILLPAEYPKEWLFKESKFFNEQYLVQAFLSFNDSFEVLWAGSYIHLYHPAELEKALSSYQRAGSWHPGSFWIRKTE